MGMREFQLQHHLSHLRALFINSIILLALRIVENLLGALLRIKEVIRRRVESSEEEDTDERGMTQRLEDILKESSGEKRTKNECSFVFFTTWCLQALSFF